MQPSDEDKRLLVFVTLDAQLWDGETDDPMAAIVLDEDRYCAKKKATPEQLQAHAFKAKWWRHVHAEDLERGRERWPTH
jgi:hypothetical protein